MILMLNITPDKTHQLQAQARQAGLPLEEYVQQALDRIAAPVPPPGLSAETGEQKAERFLRWADSHDRTKPVIPLELLDREHFYEERG